MADVKWIKITTDIFDDEKILLIESLPEADSIIVIWFKLLCLAGKMNNSGVFTMSNQMPYTDKMLATIFRRKETTVQMALQTFEQFGMIEIIDGIITIPNWGKHQSLDALEKKRSYQRELMRKKRAEQKLICDANSKANSDANSKANSDANVSQADKIRKEKEEEIDKYSIGEERSTNPRKTDYQYIVDSFNSICSSYPRVISLTNARKKAIKARLNTHSADEIVTAFRKAEASDFLRGENNRNWSANFDWIMKDANLAKVLEGNYDNKNSKNQPTEELDTATAEFLRKIEEVNGK